MTGWLVLACALWIVALAAARAQPGRSSFPGTIDQHPAIDYLGKPTSDRVTRVGSGGLTFAGPPGYLRSVLATLEVPVESQLLLFLLTRLGWESRIAMADSRLDFARLNDILTGRDRDQRYRSFSDEDRLAVSEILSETLPGWR